MHSIRRCFIAFLVTLQFVSPLTPVTFETFDTNHDNEISRDEYRKIHDMYVNHHHDANDPTKHEGGGFFAGDGHSIWHHLNIFASSSSSSSSSSTNDAENELGFWPGFINSYMMIIATEIGDKTFFIAAVLSMSNSRASVFFGSFSALIIMTILSSVIGLALPALLPRTWTHLIGGLLFLYFGFKLIYDSRSMEDGKVSEELEEVEEELLLSKKAEEDSNREEVAEVQHNDMENGNSQISNTGFTTIAKKPKPPVNVTHSVTPWDKIFTQSFTLTFLAEWGDRSQIATIALAGAKNPYGVTGGGILGHGCCTGLAVVGGRMLATRISEKSATVGGGIIFLVFGLHSLFFE